MDTARNEVTKVMGADEITVAHLRKSKRAYHAISFGFQPKSYGFGIETFSPEMQAHGKRISFLKTEEIQISDKGGYNIWFKRPTKWGCAQHS